MNQWVSLSPGIYYYYVLNMLIINKVSKLIFKACDFHLIISKLAHLKFWPKKEKKKSTGLPVVNIFNLFLRDFMLILKVLNHQKKSIFPSYMMFILKDYSLIFSFQFCTKLLY